MRLLYFLVCLGALAFGQVLGLLYPNYTTYLMSQPPGQLHAIVKHAPIHVSAVFTTNITVTLAGTCVTVSAAPTSLVSNFMATETIAHLSPR